MRYPVIATIVLTALCAAAVPAHAAEPARAMYVRAQEHERSVRNASTHATLADIRRVVGEYERLVRAHPTSGYADNALWQAAALSSLAFDEYKQDRDREAAIRLYRMLASEYPTSRLVARAKDAAGALDAKTTVAAPAPAAPPEPPAPAPQPVSLEKASDPAPLSSSDVKPARTTTGVVTLKEVRREVLPNGVRVTLDLGREVAYHQEEIANPHRIFFDLKGVRTVPSLQDTTLKFADDVVREIRLGRHPQNVTRIVLDMDGVSAYSVYPLYGPYRLVIDFTRARASAATAAAAPLVASLPAAPPPTASNPAPTAPVTVAPPADRPVPAADTIARPPVVEASGSGPSRPPLASTPAGPRTMPPAAPTTNSNGKFSLSRQLGLGVARIVIDAGHGGHDPGAQGNGLRESELTLDVALRLRKLLEKQPGVEVVMTRDTDVFIPLQERTAIANREGADLFLSIHANASRNPQAHGVETYFLNFATNPEAEAVAARENAGSGQSMHDLPDIVKSIALNNKINESRDFAATVQESMVKRLRTRNKALKDLGVKQAPFVVLIGAGMPSVLAEISFVTNKQDGSLLKGGAYRQQIAQALFDAVVRYQHGLKKMTIVAGKKSTF